MIDTTGQPFIRIRGLHKKLGWQEILRGIDIDVFRGETLCIIGPSGEGKTVTMKHVIGLMQPDAGTVEVDGIQVNGLRERELAPVRQRVSMLFQNAALFDSLTVEQNIAFPLREAGVRDRKEIKERVAAALDVVGLGQHGQKLPVNLSGGMRKRAGIARAIVTRAQCILYDEPTSSLDPVVSDVIDTVILRLQERHGITSLVVTHDMKSLFKIADRIAMLKNGLIHFLGTKEELRACPDPTVQDFINGRAEVDF
ncbi:MAG: ATP-binding cassette domain-containing protein [Verrucomicrobiaceae bacterium]|nr:ATP-binding cassette domain-containing protein [Verrucomicrobiaceae bacterium]